MYIATDLGMGMIPYDEAIDSGYGSSGQNSPCPLTPPPCSPQSIPGSYREPISYVAYVPIYNMQCLLPQSQPQCFAFPPCDYPIDAQPPSPQSAIIDQVKHVPDAVVTPTPPTQVVPPVGRLIKWSLPPPSSPQMPLPGWEPMPYAMEQFWQSAFAWFFRPMWMSHGHVWTLTPTNTLPEIDEWPWHMISYTAKVRFQCQYKHGWTSMKGRVTFWFRMKRQDDEIVCETLFKLYGQQCNRCNRQKQTFLAPLWYHEEIENAMRFLSAEVAKMYYGGDQVPMPRRLRQGNPSKEVHHDPTRCQACLEGICVVRRF